MRCRRTTEGLGCPRVTAHLRCTNATPHPSSQVGERSRSEKLHGLPALCSHQIARQDTYAIAKHTVICLVENQEVNIIAVKASYEFCCELCPIPKGTFFYGSFINVNGEVNVDGAALHRGRRSQIDRLQEPLGEVRAHLRCAALSSDKDLFVRWHYQMSIKRLKLGHRPVRLYLLAFMKQSRASFLTTRQYTQTLTLLQTSNQLYCGDRNYDCVARLFMA